MIVVKFQENLNIGQQTLGMSLNLLQLVKDNPYSQSVFLLLNLFNFFNLEILSSFESHGVLGFWGFGVLGFWV